MNRKYIFLGAFVLITLGLLLWLAQSIGALGGGQGKRYGVGVLADGVLDRGRSAVVQPTAPLTDATQRRGVEAVHQLFVMQTHVVGLRRGEVRLTVTLAAALRFE